MGPGIDPTIHGDPDARVLACPVKDAGEDLFHMGPLTAGFYTEGFRNRDPLARN